MDGQTSLKKQQFVVIYQYTILQDTEKTSPTLKTPTLNHVKFFQKKYKNKQFFFGYNILTESVFVTQMSSNARISVQWIVWVVSNCHFMSNMTSLAVTICFANFSKSNPQHSASYKVTLTSLASERPGSCLRDADDVFAAETGFLFFPTVANGTAATAAAGRVVVSSTVALCAGSGCGSTYTKRYTEISGTKRKFMTD